MFDIRKTLSTFLVIFYSLISPYHYNPNNNSTPNLKELEKSVATQIIDSTSRINSLEESLKYADSYAKGIKYESDSSNYERKNYYASFKVINQRQKDDCDGIAVAKMALLLKYNPKMLIISDDYSLTQSHAEAVIIKDRKYYLSGIKRGFDSIKGLVDEISLSLAEPKIKYKYFFICSFNEDYLLYSDDDIKEKAIIEECGLIENK